jgi:hypothetical protein
VSLSRCHFLQCSMRCATVCLLLLTHHQHRTLSTCLVRSRWCSPATAFPDQSCRQRATI